MSNSYICIKYIFWRMCSNLFMNIILPWLKNIHVHSFYSKYFLLKQLIFMMKYSLLWLHEGEPCIIERHALSPSFIKLQTLQFIHRWIYYSHSGPTFLKSETVAASLTNSELAISIPETIRYQRYCVIYLMIV